MRQLLNQIQLRFGASLGMLAYYVFAKRRRLALQNLSLAFDNRFTVDEQKKIIRQVFAQLGMNLIEFLCLKKFTAENLSQFVTFHGLENLENAYAKKCGVMALTAHIGNWELLAGAMALKGFNTAIVAKKARQKIVNDFLLRQRNSTGLKVFSGRHLIRDLFKHMNQGGLVGIVLDQSAITRDGVVVPFFGRHASTLKSLAILSMRSKAAILPIYIYRDKKLHHHVVIEPAIEHADVSTDSDPVYSRTLQYTQWLEKAIRAHPEQWIWTHNRWKTHQ